jgi:hypothetical protein
MCRNKLLCSLMRIRALQVLLSVVTLKLKRTWRWGLMRGEIGEVGLAGQRSVILVQ